jgi:hypothetical protein
MLYAEAEKNNKTWKEKDKTNNQNNKIKPSY